MKLEEQKKQRMCACIRSMFTDMGLSVLNNEQRFKACLADYMAADFPDVMKMLLAAIDSNYLRTISTAVNADMPGSSGIVVGRKHPQPQ